jgi:hypothetical protein
MSDDRQQIRRERTRRSLRNRQNGQNTTQSDGLAYTVSQDQLAEIDDIISGIVSPARGATAVDMGGQDAQNVRPLTSEELVKNFRQQGGQ